MGGDDDLAAAAVVQQVAVVGEGGAYLDGTCRGIDRSADGINTPLARIFRAVAQQESDAGGLADELIH